MSSLLPILSTVAPVPALAADRQPLAIAHRGASGY
jgi:hypothetical protein